jgi:hypothetical protein
MDLLTSVVIKAMYKEKQHFNNGVLIQDDCQGSDYSEYSRSAVKRHLNKNDVNNKHENYHKNDSTIIWEKPIPIDSLVAY